MNNCLVSVIVPIYNVERYLEKCIDSILRQTYENLELILVDDGSPDNCPEICDRYAETDSRIKVIHTKNGGVSSARNLGLKEANGEFICFVDPDDWIPQDAIELLVRGIIENDADIVYGGMKLISFYQKSSSAAEDSRIIIKEDSRKWMDYFGTIPPGPCAKMYKKSLIYSHNIFFPQDIKHCEDTIFLITYLRYCSIVASINNVVYVYNRFNSFSATRRYYSEQNKWMRKCVEEFAKLCEETKDELAPNLLSIIAEKYLSYMCLLCVRFMQGTTELKLQSINESYSLMKPYLIVDNRNKDLKAYSQYNERIAIALSEDAGADEVYSSINRKYNKGIRRFAIRIVEFALGKLKYFWYYQLGMN